MTASKSFGVVAAVALAALLFTAVATSPALAGKPDHANGGGKGGGKNQSSASLWVEPALASYPAYGYDFTVKGSGFNPDSVVHMSFGRDGSCCLNTNFMSDSDGNVSFGWTTGDPGTYRFAAFQDYKGNGWKVYASVSVEVVGQ